mgnify:CR=1 FL=1
MIYIQTTNENYGQTIEDIGCDIVNDSEEPIFGILHITAQIGKNNLVDIYESEFIINVDKSTEQVRQYIVAAVIKDIKLDDETIRQIIN